MPARVLAGQPGILSVVKAMRARPFAEFDIVYYDGAKTNLEAILKRLHENGCRDAVALAPADAEEGGLRLRVHNPIVTPGDFLHVTLQLPDGAAAKAAVSPPAGWSAADGAERALKPGENRCDVLVPAAAKAGAHDVSVQVARGAETQTLKVKIEVVTRVK